MKKALFLFVLFTVLCLGGCGDEEVFFDDKMFDNEMIDAHDNFIPDCSAAEVNKVGNTSTNITTCGRGGVTRGGKVTGQGEWAYYFYDGQIKKIDENGNIFSLCYASKVHSLNVIGDFLYYLSEGVIYKMRTDGAMQEALITNADNNNSFIVKDGMIYYVGTKKVSSSQYEYTISKYDMTTQETTDFPIFMGTDWPIMAGFYNDTIYYFSDTDSGRKWTTVDMKTSEVSQFDTEVWNGIVSGGRLTHTYVTIEDALTGARAFHVRVYDLNNRGELVKEIDVDTGYTHMYLKNINKGNYIINYGTKLLCIPMENLSKTEILGSKIVEENETIETVYVVGDYIYYELETSNSSYDTRPMYRIKINGTNWSSL